MKSVGKMTLVAALGGAIALGGNLALNQSQQTGNKNHTEKSRIEKPYFQFAKNTSYPEVTKDFTYAAEKTVNGVVHVTTEIKTTHARDPFLDRFFGPGASGTHERSHQASGSGVIISEDGYIVTNNHVVDGASSIEITLNNKESFEAEIIGTDPNTDLALLKIDANGLPAVGIGNSDEVRIGEWVLAVGNPFNLTSTVTAGIVSAKSRSINILSQHRNVNDPNFFPLEAFIQTDAAVNPGNSGGALVNSQGQLVGINTAIASKTGSYTGYSFAVPANIVKKVSEDLLEYGMVQRAFIGVQIQKVDQNVVNQLELPNAKGVLVAGLVDGGAASDAGLQKDDVILRIDDMEVNNVPALQEQVGKHRPGDKISVTVRRDGEERNFAVVLRNQDGTSDVVDKEDIEILEALGAGFSKPSSAQLQKLNLETGVMVSQVRSGKLRSTGIKPGFVITSINQIPVKSPNQVVEILTSTSGGVLIEGFYQKGHKKYYGLGI